MTQSRYALKGRDRALFERGAEIGRLEALQAGVWDLAEVYRKSGEANDEILRNAVDTLITSVLRMLEDLPEVGLVSEAPPEASTITASGAQ